MKKYEEQLTQDALLLDQYLDQYRHCIRKKRDLERRREEIVREFDHPLGSVNYDGMPHSGGDGVGCAALSFRLDEIDTRIKDQMDRAVKVLAEIMNVIDFLPENSTERSIVEHRYIDRMGWRQICGHEHISRTPAIKYWKKGLYDLLEFKKVSQILKEYMEALERDDPMEDF